MFSALKFAAAGVIVALFGGFLLAGILSTPNREQVPPAAVTGSPSPTTTEGLLSGLVTEEVEPGVLRVINDGVRDLLYPADSEYLFTVDVTPNGSVWLSGGNDRQRLFRLGEEPAFEDVEGLPYREVAPDGSLWAMGEGPDHRSGIFSFDGEGWTLRATTPGSAPLAIGPDGTVWMVGGDRDKFCPDIEDEDCVGTALLRLEDDGSLTTIEDWSDVYDGDAAWYQLAVSPDGDVWLVGTPRGRPARAEVLLRFDGEGWEAIPGPEGWTPGDMGRYLDVGPDGALWVKASAVGDLARFDDPGWTTFTQDDGVEPWGHQQWPFTDLLDVAADGSPWLLGSPTEDGWGVAHYDGTTWASYLVRSPIHDFAIAPDGSVWLRAAEWGRVQTYVITPEAVAATE